MDHEEASARRVGQTLKDKWVVERLLGVGGMASVYLGRHKIGRLEAIKILHPEIAASEQIRTRFEQEARAVNSLRHPGVVEVRDIDVTEDGVPFLVMELLEGESLATRARREPALGIQDILRLAAETLDALAAVHAHGIIHRDIKPDNLFITLDGRIKVLDFGIARVRSGGGRALATQVGVTLGTMAYMPPEQARGLEIDARADVYAVGATIYRLLSGRIVHDASTDAELVMKAMCEPATPLGSVAASVPATICAVVDRALAFDRADRYPDALTMKADLDAAASRRGASLWLEGSAASRALATSEMFAMRDPFFGEMQGFLMNALEAVPNHAEAFVRVERRLEKLNDAQRLLELYAKVAATPPRAASVLANQVLNRLLPLSAKSPLPEPACKQLLPLVAANPKLLDALDAHCCATKRAPFACELIEQALEGAPPDLVLARRERLIDLYLGDAAAPMSAMGHIEALLTTAPANAKALNGAEKLLATPKVASRAAAALRDARRTRGH